MRIRRKNINQMSWKGKKKFFTYRYRGTGKSGNHYYFKSGRAARNFQDRYGYKY